MKVSSLLLFSVAFSFIGVNPSKGFAKPSMIRELERINSFTNLTDDKKEELRVKEFRKFIGEWGSSRAQANESNSPSAVTDDWLGMSFALDCRTLNEKGEVQTRLYPSLQRTKEISYEMKGEGADELGVDDLDQSTQVKSKIIYSMDYHTLSGRAAITHSGYLQNFILEKGYLISSSPYEIKTFSSISQDSSPVRLLKYDQRHLIGIIQGKSGTFSRELDRIMFCAFYRR